MRRKGFTLIELLVVITIISLLVSLLAAGVFRSLGKMKDVKNVRDISNLQLALVQFMAKYGVDYVPSRLVLCENRDDYFADAPADTIYRSQLHQDSLAYLNKLWRRLDWSNGIDWNSDGVISAPVMLEGDQCLVFFLGGIQTSVGCVGFADNQTNPAQIVDANGKPVNRVRPFFEFDVSRLKNLPHGMGDSTYLSYLDAYGKQPFVYLSSYKRSGGYNPYGASDSGMVSPYIAEYILDTSTMTYQPFKYCNNDTFQIVSAGRDRVFGPGGTSWNGKPVPLPSSFPPPPPRFILGWNSMTADQIVREGQDDIANFYDGILGTRE